jgi:hypothetical protein
MLERLLAEAEPWGPSLAAVALGLLLLIVLMVIWRRGRAHQVPVRAYDREQRQLAAFRRQLASPVAPPGPPTPRPTPPARPPRRERAAARGVASAK